MFKKLYSQLNTNQKLAVDTINGPVMVVAGPGTGKTKILTLRIANILEQTKIKPENILALTFTEAAATTMRKRLLDVIGNPAYYVHIKTFHSFCNDVIKNYPEEFPHIISSKNITEIEQIKIIESIIEKNSFEYLKPFGDQFYYLKSILSGINELKRDGVTPEKFLQVVENEEIKFKQIGEDLYHTKGAHEGKMKGEYQELLKQITKNKELAFVYAEYQKRLTHSKFYDFNDMIMEVLDMLSRDKNLLHLLQEKYQYVLVDEYQDTNNAQNKIIELICRAGENPNIFVVGDEKQSIFRFQGASLQNFISFKALYPNALIVALDENYRSTQAILDSAHSLIAGPVKLKANVDHHNVKISLYSFSQLEAESYFIANDIRQKIDSGVPAQEIAVLYRENKDAFVIGGVFEKVGVPFSIESDQNILEDEDIIKLVALLRAINEFGSQDKLLEALHIDFLNILPLDVYKIIFYSRKNKMSAFDVIKSPEEIKLANLENPARALEIYKQFSDWAVASHNLFLADLFEKVIRESGFVSHIMSLRNSVEKMDKLHSLFGEIKAFMEINRNAKLSDFFVYLDTLKAHNVLIKKSQAAAKGNRTRLMTAHRSKGLEFEYVYIIKAFEGHWGNKRRPNLLPILPQALNISSEVKGEWDKNDDERRLFYVALTRAKKEVIICYSQYNAEGREQMPSQFIQEINSEHIAVLDSTLHEENYNKNRSFLYDAPKENTGMNIKDKEFVKELFLEHGLSVTSLNNYLTCPWQYFYTNLVQIPKAKSKHQMYGTAIHETLKNFFELARDSGKTPEKDWLLEKFSIHLKKQSLNENYFEESLSKGKRALSGYYDTYLGAWNLNVVTEYNVTGVALSPEIKLTGKIDKMEIIADDNKVNVIDYKTSQPKTRNEIEGSTKNSDGNIKRQLVFYNLLLNKFEDGKFKMVTGEIDFVEPNSKSQFKKENFPVTKEEIDELEKVIRRVSDEILNLSFWDKLCDNKDCEFCAIRRMMK